MLKKPQEKTASNNESEIRKKLSERIKKVCDAEKKAENLNETASLLLDIQNAPISAQAKCELLGEGLYTIGMLVADYHPTLVNAYFSLLISLKQQNLPTNLIFSLLEQRKLNGFPCALLFVSGVVNESQENIKHKNSNLSVLLTSMTSLFSSEQLIRILELNDPDGYTMGVVMFRRQSSIEIQNRFIQMLIDVTANEGLRRVQTLIQLEYKDGDSILSWISKANQPIYFSHMKKLIEHQLIDPDQHREKIYKNTELLNYLITHADFNQKIVVESIMKGIIFNGKRSAIKYEEFIYRFCESKLPAKQKYDLLQQKNMSETTDWLFGFELGYIGKFSRYVFILKTLKSQGASNQMIYDLLTIHTFAHAKLRDTLINLDEDYFKLVNSMINDNNHPITISQAMPLLFVCEKRGDINIKLTDLLNKIISNYNSEYSLYIETIIDLIKQDPDSEVIQNNVKGMLKLNNGEVLLALINQELLNDDQLKMVGKKYKNEVVNAILKIEDTAVKNTVLSNATVSENNHPLFDVINTQRGFNAPTMTNGTFGKLLKEKELIANKLVREARKVKMEITNEILPAEKTLTVPQHKTEEKKTEIIGDLVTFLDSTQQTNDASDLSENADSDLYQKINLNYLSVEPNSSELPPPLEKQIPTYNVQKEYYDLPPVLVPVNHEVQQSIVKEDKKTLERQVVEKNNSINITNNLSTMYNNKKVVPVSNTQEKKPEKKQENRRIALANK